MLPEEEPLKSVNLTAQLTETEILRLLHQLQVHQIELELQNQELILAKEQAQNASEKYIELYDFAPTGYFTLSKEGKILELNLSGAEMLGRNRAELWNRQFGIYVSIDSRPSYTLFLTKAFESNTKQTCELELSTANNIPRYVYVTGVMNSNIDQCLVTATEITDLKLIEKVLLESEENHRLVLENSLDAILLTDPEGRIFAANFAACQMFQRTEKEICEVGRNGLVDVGDPRLNVLLEERKKTGKINGELTMVRKDGTKFPVELSTSIFLDHKNVQKTSMIIRDITERKKADEILRISEAKWRSLYEILPVGVSIVDSEHKIIDFNTSLRNILGITREGLLKGDYSQRIYLGPDNTIMNPDEFPSIRAFKENKMIRDVEIGVKKEDDSIIWTNVSAFPFHYLNSCITITTDITRRKLAEETIKRNETILRIFIEHTPASVAMFDMDMKYIVTSRRYLIDYDLVGKNLIGKSHYEVLPEIPQRWKEIHARCLSGATEHCEEDPFLRSNGKQDWVRWEICPWFLNDGKIGGIILFSEVITARKIMEESLKTSEELWHKLVATSPDFIALFDIEGKYLYMNHFAEGFSENDISGKNAVDFIAEDSKTEFEIKFEACIRTQQTQHFEYNALGNFGVTCKYEAYLVPLIEQAKVTSVMSIAKDITERKRTEEEIRNSKEQLMQLYKHLNDVREEERTSIAREIHDDLGQSLAGLKIDLIGIREDLNDKISTTNMLNKAISLVDSTIKTVQRLSSDLRPQMIDELGLASAIEWQSGEFKKRTGIKCKLYLQDIEDLDTNIAISLFRIFQASLTNIMLHSKATSITIRLKKIKETLQLRIIDDGRGITRDQLNSSKSFGIIGMRERANQINGKFEILTQENIGTEIIVSVPLRPEK